MVSAKSGPRSPVAPGQVSAADRRRRWNWRLLVGTLLLVSLLGGAGHFWVRHQRQRLAVELRQAAGAAEAREEWRAALRAWENYLTLLPVDPAGVQGRALAFVRVAETPAQKSRALRLVAQALGRVPGEVSLLTAQARLALEVGDLPLALAQADSLLQLRPDDAEMLRMRVAALTGLAMTGGGVSWSAVARALEGAVEQLPSDEILTLQLARLYRERPETAPTGRSATEAAEATLAGLVAAAPQSATAYLTRWEYRRAFRVGGGDEDLNVALALGPDLVRVRLAAGQAALERRAWDEAIAHFARLIDLEPTNRRGYLGRAEAEAAAGHIERARATLEAGLAAVDPRDFLLNVRLAERWLKSDLTRAGARLELAQESLRQASEAPGFEVREASWTRALALVRARWYLARRELAAALDASLSALAEPVLPGDPGPNASDHVAALHVRAACYQALDQSDRAAAAFEAARQLEPLAAEHALAAGRAWLDAGQPELALAAWEHAAGLLPPRAVERRALVAGVARALLERERRRSPEERSWSAVDEALSAVAQDRTNRQEWLLLTAERHVLAGEYAPAIAQLRAAVAQFPHALEVWRRLVLTLVEARQPDEADQVLNDPRLLAWPPFELLRARVARLLATEQFTEAQVLVRDARAQAREAERAGHLELLAEVHLAAGDAAAARRTLVEQSLFEPRRPAVIGRLADLALEAGDWPDLQVWEDRLRELEGRDGAAWRYYQARRLLVQAPRRDDPRLAQAAALTDEVHVRRPRWTRAALLQGLLAEASGAPVDEALAAYRAALESPLADLLALERLVGLLDQQGRLAEADSYLHAWAERLTTSRLLSARLIESSVDRGQPGRALRLARLAVAQRPQDALRRLWLAQTLAAVGDAPAAEEAFRALTSDHPGDARAWAGLFTCQLNAGHRDAARETLVRLAAEPALAVVPKFQVLAEGFGRLGDPGFADQAYREALRLAPADLGLHERAAAFFLGRDDALAEQLLRRLIELAPNPAAARAQLIRTLVGRGGEEAWQEAWRLLQAGRPSGRPPQVDDLRLEAWVLARRGTTAERRQAVDRLTALRDELGQAQPDDLRLLAELHRELRQPDRARRVLESLAKQPAAGPADLVALIEVLLELGAGDAAGPHLARLIEREPTAWATLSIQARWLVAQGRAAEIEGTFEPHWQSQLAALDDTGARGLVHWQAGQLYALANQAPLAERHFRLALETAPQGFAVWVRWLTAQGRAAEAIDHCSRQLADFGIPEAAVALCETLTAAGARPELLARAAPLVASADQRFAEHVGYRLARGNLAFTAGEPALAIEHYRQVVASEPDHVTALNNLAMLLSEDPLGLGEADVRISAALKLAGPQAWLQETLAVIRLRQGKLDEARRLLGALASEPSRTPTSLFHLALAQRQAGALDEARRTLAEAELAQLDARHLSPSEQRQWAELTESLRAGADGKQP